VTPPRLGPPCGCERPRVHDGCAVDRARLWDALVELLAILEPGLLAPDPCTGRCHSLDFDAVRHYAEQYGVCPCHLSGGRRGDAS